MITSPAGEAIGHPNVLYESVFKMWHTPKWENNAVQYRESADGLTWGAATPTNLPCGHPYVFKIGSTYYAYTGVVGVFKQYTSADGIVWSQNGGNLGLGAVGRWDDGELGNICVWQESVNDWRAIYEAKRVGTNWKVGYATSTDGLSWTKYAGNPIIVTGGMVGGPEVKKINGVYHMWAQCSLSNSLPTDIYKFRSTDLIDWTRQYPVPVVSRTGVAAVDTGQVADPSIVVVGDTVYMFYVATTNGNTQDNWSIQLSTISAEMYL